MNSACSEKKLTTKLLFTSVKRRWNVMCAIALLYNARYFDGFPLVELVGEARAKMRARYFKISGNRPLRMIKPYI